MGKWLRRTRGLAGLGGLGALFGGAVGAAVTTIATLMAWGTVPTFNLLMGMGLGALFGLGTTTGFGLLLLLTQRGRRVQELSVPTATAMSAAISSALVIGIMTLARGGVQPLGVMLSQIAMFGGFGGVVGGGLVVMAKRAGFRDLGQGGGPLESIE